MARVADGKVCRWQGLPMARGGYRGKKKHNLPAWLSYPATVSCLLISPARTPDSLAFRHRFAGLHATPPPRQLGVGSSFPVLLHRRRSPPSICLTLYQVTSFFHYCVSGGRKSGYIDGFVFLASPFFIALFLFPSFSPDVIWMRGH